MDAKETLERLVPGPPDWAVRWEELEKTGLWPLLSRLSKTPQNPAYHGEGDVLAHTRLVCGALAGLEGFRRLDGEGRLTVFLAALLHDIGKISCTRLEDGQWTSPRHGPVGAAMARELMWLEWGWCGRPELRDLRETVCALIRCHALPVHAALEEDGPRRLIRAAADGELLPGFTLERLCLLARADALGKVCADQREQLDAVELCGALAEECGCLTGPRAFASPYTAFACYAGRVDRPDYELYDSTWGEVVLMCGLPGTGKDTWIASHCPGLPVVSLDAVRAELGAAPSGPQQRVAEEARNRARALLRERRPFVWNATSITPDLRKKQIDLFASYGASVRVVYLETGWEEERRRNAGRAGPARVPEEAILGMLARLTPPERFEAHRVEWHCI